MVDFRVVSFNVRSLRDDRAAVARILRELDADVVCLQEAPKYLRWRGRCAALARAARMLYVAGGRTTGGTAMLTSIRVDVRAAHEHRLPSTPRLTSRGLVVASLAKGGAALTAVSAHLGLDAAERTRHLTEITELVARHDNASAVIAADMNERPGAPSWSRLAEHYTDVGAADPTPTFSTADPRRRIDGIFIRGPIEVRRYQVLDSPDVRAASDHRPVVADMVLPA
ncbi:MAG TPA: endonuclease/exonuclease/phosphatase family protein [Jiangellaceae bacterium]|nr:endonuclease/exonuclease/phosphatase family protein [Jiangellaceae bacterium]